MNYQGVYINLDRSTERRVAIEAELARYNLAPLYSRFQAVEGNEPRLNSPLKNPNEIGCFLSHAGALRQGLDANNHLHIIEDDTIFSALTERTLEWVISSGSLDEYDILYTDIAMPLSNDSYRLFKSLYDQTVTHDKSGGIEKIKFSVINLGDIPFFATSSYLVNKNSLQKLNHLYEDEIAQGIRVPIDMFIPYQAKVGAIKIGCLFPFVTSINVEDTLSSTVRITSDTSRKFLAANIGRYSFFVGCDWDKCQRLMDAYIKQPSEDDRHAQLLAKLLAFSLMIDQ